MQRLIESLSHGVPPALTELVTLGRTLKQRATDVLASFNRPGTSNGPTEAINGRLEHLPDRHSGSATSPTTSPDACWRAVGSDPDYTMDREEPANGPLLRPSNARTRLKTAALSTRGVGTSTWPPARTTTWPLTPTWTHTTLLRWSTWRRKHQARARDSHYRRRGTNDLDLRL